MESLLLFLPPAGMTVLTSPYSTLWYYGRITTYLSLLYSVVWYYGRSTINYSVPALHCGITAVLLLTSPYSKSLLYTVVWYYGRNTIDLFVQFCSDLATSTSLVTYLVLWLY